MDTTAEIQTQEENGQRIDETKKMKNTLTEIEWKVIEEVAEIMHPAYVLMKKMQSAAFTLSDFFVTWSLIKISMQQNESKPNLLTDLSKQMIANMLLYEPRIFLNPLLIACVYLDPRVSAVLAWNDNQGVQRKVIARSEIAKIHQRLIKENETVAQVSSSDKTDRFSDLERAFEQYIDSTEPNSSSNGQSSNDDATSLGDSLALEMECIEFEKEKRLPLKSNILDFWEFHKKKYPLLYPIAQVVMAVPSSQTSVERCFSSFGYIYANLRTKLQPDLLEAILIIRTNRELFDQVADEELMKAAEQRLD